MRYQSNRPKRQFLAGVKCPECQAMDTVVQVQVFEPAFEEYIECTQCGHSEGRPDAEQVADLQSATLGGLNDELQPVRFVPNK